MAALVPAAETVHASVSHMTAALIHARDTLKYEGTAAFKGRKDKKARSGNPSAIIYGFGAGARGCLERTLSETALAVRNEYARGFVLLGQGFEVGDEQARTALAAMLANVQTGLVAVLIQMLRGLSIPKKASSTLDLGQLAEYCVLLRGQACRCLIDFRQRLVKTVKGVVPRKTVPTASDGKPVATKQKVHVAQTSKQKSSKSVQFAMVRTRPSPGRKASQSSTSSAGSRTLVGSPTRSSASSLAATKSKKVASAPTQNRNGPVSSSPSKTKHKSQMESTSTLPIIQRHEDAEQPHPISNPIPRGLSRTQTIRSFASASTRLGEIPMHKWAEQPDWDEMSRINRRAGFAVGQHESVSTTIAPGRQLRAGLLARFFRRGPAPAVAAIAE